MKRRTQHGVTLIELLVAMTIFSFLSVAVLFSLRTGIRTLERTRERVSAARRADGAGRALDRMLGGIMLVNAEYTLPGTSQPAYASFFQGEPQAMRFVTSYSLEQGLRGAPHIAELTVIPREDRAGFRLIVNELSYYGPPSAGALITGLAPDPAGGPPALLFQPVSASPRSFVLADRLPACQFIYLDRVPPPEIDRWVPVWRRGYYPRAVRIDMGPNRTVTGQVNVSIIH